MGIRCTQSFIACFGRCIISDVAELVLQGHLVFKNINQWGHYFRGDTTLIIDRAKQWSS
jgi:hypothetical protein